MGLGVAWPDIDGGGGVPAAGTLTRADFAPGAGVAVARRGAKFDGDAYSDASWAPTVAGEAEFEFTFQDAGAALGDENILGVFSSVRVRVVREANGNLRLIASSTLLTVADFFAVDGRPHHARIVLGVNTQAVYLDGELVGEGTGALTYSILATPHYIGNASPTAPGFTGTLWDVHFIDPNSDANTAHFPLDHLDASGNYPNTHPGSTVADATVNGTVLPKEINAVTAGSPYTVQPVRVMVSRTSVLSASGADGTINSLVASVDPYGWATSTSINPAIAGTGVLHLTGRIRVTAVSGSDNLAVNLRNGGVVLGSQELTLDTVNEWVPFAITFADDGVDDTYSFNARVAGVAATTDWEVDDVYLTLTLYPNLAS